MKKNFQIRGNLMIEVPKPFRRQQLSLVKQCKDKQIRKELQELERKRKKNQQLEKQWKKQKKELQEFKQAHQEKNAILAEKENKLKQEVFKLQIRKEQIESRKNPQIIVEKGKQLMKYLKCIPFTIGKRVQKIIFWGGEERYFRLKFLIEFGRDRFLKKGEIQRHIFDNLNRIVLCKKVQFEGQWIMLSIKEVFNHFQTIKSLSSHHHKPKLFPTVSFRESSYEISIYAITGPYFCLTKQYSYKQLFSWSTILNCKNNQTKGVKPRLSVAENLAKQNILRELAEKKISEISGDSEISQSQLQSLQALKNVSKRNLSTPINTENENQSTNLIKTEVWEVNQSHQSEISDPSYNNTSHLPSEDIEDSDPSENGEDPTISRRTCRSKSSFHPNSNPIKSSKNKLNKSFLGGREQWLIPRGRPLQNIIILKNKKQLYILSEYFALKEKRFIMEKAISRFRLKIKLKNQLKKCLFYKIITIKQFYQTNILTNMEISLPMLFMIKEHQLKDGYELKMTCCSTKLHPNVPRAIDFVVSLHREKEKNEPKEDKNKRTSNMKNSVKNSTIRKSKDNKRKSSIRMGIGRHLPEHQKSGFHFNSKPALEHFKPFSKEILQKFDQFMKNHYISIYQNRFFTKNEMVLLIKTIVRIQAWIKGKLLNTRYKQRKSKSPIPRKYFKEAKIFITCLSHEENTVIVYFDSLEFGRSSESGNFTFPKQYFPTVLQQIDKFVIFGSLLEMKERLKQAIDEAIFKQTEMKIKKERQKPLKNRQAIQRFFKLVYFRNKAKKNIFYVKKMFVKQKFYVLIIRRSCQIKSLLDCCLYYFPKNILEVEKSPKKKDQNNLQPGWNKPVSHHSNKQPLKKDKSYQSHHIYLKQQYFKNIERKSIADEFLIDYKVFLLKPPKSSNVYYIERLSCIDINSEEINKEMQNLDKEGNQFRQSLMSNNSLKCLINTKTSNKKIVGPKSKETPSILISERKNSIEKNTLEVLEAIRSNFIKQLVPMKSRVSLVDSSSQKNKQGLKINGNHHESIIYYSLYKAADVFFYVDLYIITENQALDKVHSQRLYKKELQDMGISLVHKKIAQWLQQNEDQYLIAKEIKQKIEENPSKLNIEESLNIFSKCIPLIQSYTKKRFSFEMQKDIFSLSEKEKGNRNNTLPQVLNQTTF